MSDPDTPDDGELVSRCRRGDGAAWRVLVQRYQRLVYAVARRARLDEHAAADVFQTVFSRLLKSLPTLEQPQRLRAWIVTTAKREALVELRRGQRTVSMTASPDGEGEACGVDELADEAILPEQLLDDLQQLHLLRRALDALDERCRGLLTLLFADDDERPPYQEISARLGMPPGSIGPTRARCLNKLRGLLAAAGA